jgi:hypothetical protein
VECWACLSPPDPKDLKANPDLCQSEEAGQWENRGSLENRDQMAIRKCCCDSTKRSYRGLALAQKEETGHPEVRS